MLRANESYVKVRKNNSKKKYQLGFSVIISLLIVLSRNQHLWRFNLPPPYHHLLFLLKKVIFVWNWVKLWENNLLAFSYDKIQRSVTQADIQETNLATQNSSRSSLSYSEHWAGNVLGTYSWPKYILV